MIEMGQRICLFKENLWNLVLNKSETMFGIEFRTLLRLICHITVA